MPYFSLEEARQLLPWLRSLFREMEPLRKELALLEDGLETLQRQARGNGGPTIEEAIQSQRKRLEEVSGKLGNLIEAINNKGIILRDIERGLFDFPSRWQGREVHLCWLLEEPDITFWHETDTGFASRKPL